MCVVYTYCLETEGIQASVVRRRWKCVVRYRVSLLCVSILWKVESELRCMIPSSWIRYPNSSPSSNKEIRQHKQSGTASGFDTACASFSLQTCRLFLIYSFLSCSALLSFLFVLISSLPCLVICFLAWWIVCSIIFKKRTRSVWSVGIESLFSRIRDQDKK